MNGRLVPCPAVTADERAAMFRLMDRHFLGVTPAIFERDLADKDFAILLTGDDGELRGFTSFALVPTRFAGEELWVVYSGDTIVDRGARGSFALAGTWIEAIRSLRAARGGARMVWLLICSSPRTYRFLPLFFRRFYPQAGVTKTPGVRNLIDDLARARYGDAYDQAGGIVRLAEPQVLRPEQLAADREAYDAHDQHFLRANPGYLQGDELTCFAELADENLTPAGWRMVRAGARRRDAAGRAPAAVDPSAWREEEAAIDG